MPIDPESLMLREVGHAVGLGGPVHKRYEDPAITDRLKDAMKVAGAAAEAYPRRR